jgi:hemerythrin-like domain-containing protein
MPVKMSDKPKNEQRNHDRIGPDDFRDPIDAIYREHRRVSEFCEWLLELASDPDADDSTKIATLLLDYLETDLPIHLADEEEDLFPLLERRAPSNEHLTSVLELLVLEHRDDIEYGRGLLEPLRAIAVGKRPADATLLAFYMRAFRMLLQRHLAVENNFVLPSAKQYLSADDKAELGRSMVARRGLSSPG